jgi:hypothetical protein
MLAASQVLTLPGHPVQPSSPKRHTRVFQAGLMVAAWLPCHPVHATGCEIIDAYSAVASTAAATAGATPEEELRAYHEQVIDRFPGLYAVPVLGLKPGPYQEAGIHAALKGAREDNTRDQLLVQLRAAIEDASKAFAVFPDFRCDFPVYLTETLGQIDGAGREVDGRRSLVLGIGNIAAEQSSLPLAVLMSHEMFHRYHYQAAGYSDDLNERQPIWQALWVEGLATYASQVLAPGTTLGDALADGELAQRAAPSLPSLASDLLLHMDETNLAVFNTYFAYGDEDVQRRGLPWRSGYYVGYLVAKDLARRHTLAALAHLKGSRLHDMVAAELRRLAKSTAGATQ